MSTGNHLQFGPDGKAKFKSGKALFAADGTPCCCTPPCSLCNTNGSPGTVLVRLSGFTVAAGCVDLLSCSATWNTFDINHDFCLPVCPGSPCIWSDAFSGRIDVDTWSGNRTCSGARTGNETLLAVAATPFSSLNRTWDIRIVIAHSFNSADCTSTGAACLTGYAIRGLGTASAVDHCLDTVSYTGAQVTTSLGITGGTIDIIPNGC